MMSMTISMITYFVPFIMVGEKYRTIHLRKGGALEDIAPTMLEILEIPSPPEMTGGSLISK